MIHRVNIRGETHTNRFYYDESLNQWISRDTPNIVSYVIRIDFYILYPFNRYHGGIMYMPGSMINFFDCTSKEIRHKCLNIIYSKQRFDADSKFIFNATVKVECPKEKINDFINFPPVFRNFEIKNDESIIGSFMYNYGQGNKINTVDESDTKLTMALDTMGEFKTFGCYYLWFLIYNSLKVTDVKNVTLYDCHIGFNSFVNSFMNERIAILSGEKHVNEKFYKICMNVSYGYDGLNTERYNKIKIVIAD